MATTWLILPKYIGNVAIAEHLDNYRRGNVQIRDLANNLSGKVIFTQG